MKAALFDGDNVKLGSLGFRAGLRLRPDGIKAPLHASKYSFLVVEINSVIFIGFRTHCPESLRT